MTRSGIFSLKIRKFTECMKYEDRLARTCEMCDGVAETRRRRKRGKEKEERFKERERRGKEKTRSKEQGARAVMQEKKSEERRRKGKRVKNMTGDCALMYLQEYEK